VATAYRRGDHDAVLRTAGTAFAELSTRPGGEEWVAGPPLLAGTVLAAREQYAAAADALRDGLTRLPGTAVADQLGDGDWHALLLVEVLMVRGALAEAQAWTDHLLTAGPPIDLRLGATRAAVHLRIIRGDLDGAHHLINAAADLANRARSNLGAVLVATDRAVLDAGAGRHDAAVREALAAAEALVGGHRTPQALLAADQAGVVAMAAGRASAATGDTISAAAMADLGRRAAVVRGSRLAVVRALLTTSAAARAFGDADPAEVCARDATRGATELGAEPLAALGLVEQAEVGDALGLAASSGPLHHRAQAELARLGLVLEAERFARRVPTPARRTGP
jgi:hypothetical protein